MAEYRVDIGTMSFSGDSVALGSLEMATTVDVAGTELAADVFSVVIDFEAGAPILFSPADYDGILTEDLHLFASADVTVGDLTQVPYGTPVNLYKNGSPAYKFFVHDIRRTSRTQYQVNALSAVGMLDNMAHLGGVYVNKTAGALIGEIIDGAFAYSVDPSVASQKVAGWLPIDTARNNLHQVLFALGITIVKDADGDLVFTFLSAESPASIPDSRIFLGGSVGYNALATAVALTEHSYYKRPDTQESQIFTNVGGVWADHLLVQFSEPAYDLRAEGLEIHEAGANYAVMSGAGTLLGKLFAHDVRVHQRPIPGSTAIVPNLITSDSDTMINSLNAMSVLDRLVAYYGSRKTITADLLVDGEKAGDVVSFTDAFGDPATGFLASLDARATSIVRASCTIITGYVPTGQGNSYTHRILVTASGAVTLPEGVTKVQIVLIQGGHGGQGGYAGQHGLGGDTEHGGDLTFVSRDDEGIISTGYVYSGGNQGIAAGGEAGAAGEAGKIFVADLTITAGASITASVGAGGAGGAAEGGEGSPGGATTITIGTDTYTSEDGRNSQPYVDLFTGDVMGLSGEAGHAGGAGGQTDTESLFGAQGHDGLPGESIWDQTGGVGGTGIIHTESEGKYYHLSGGGGGGAAWGSNGSAGGAGGIAHKPLPGGGEAFDIYSGGAGGDGADAAAPNTPAYGCGGGGGNGGGGGGNAAGYRVTGYDTDDYVYYNEALDGGAGGAGSVGGDGGAGVCIIYY